MFEAAEAVQLVHLSSKLKTAEQQKHQTQLIEQHTRKIKKDHPKNTIPRWVIDQQCRRACALAWHPVALEPRSKTWKKQFLVFILYMIYDSINLKCPTAQLFSIT